jgi:hypothetical protein
MSIKNLPTNMKRSILEKISENNDPAALKVALGNKNLEEVLEPRKINFRITRNRNHRRVFITGRPMSPVYFGYEGDRPLLQGSMSTPMRKHLQKIINGKNPKKKNSHRLRPENFYKIEIFKALNDKTGYTYNYDEMERIGRQYVEEENRRVLNRIRAMRKWKAIQKMRKKKRNSDIEHKSLLLSVLKNKKKMSYY